MLLIVPLSRLFPLQSPVASSKIPSRNIKTLPSIKMAATGNNGVNHHGDIDESQVPGTVQLVDIDEHLATQHARGQKDIILVPTPSDDPEDPLNWSPGRKRLALTCIML